MRSMLSAISLRSSGFHDLLKNPSASKPMGEMDNSRAITAIDFPYPPTDHQSTQNCRESEEWHEHESNTGIFTQAKNY